MDGSLNQGLTLVSLGGKAPAPKKKPKLPQALLTSAQLRLLQRQVSRRGMIHAVSDERGRWNIPMRSLDALERKGIIELKSSDSSHGYSERTYVLTDKGREALGEGSQKARRALRLARMYMERV
jgi:hypothetical protein